MLAPLKRDRGRGAAHHDRRPRSGAGATKGTICLAGPPLVKVATGEVVEAETPGGGDTHTRLSGVAVDLAQDSRHALERARERIGHRGAAPGVHRAACSSSGGGSLKRR